MFGRGNFKAIELKSGCSVLSDAKHYTDKGLMEVG